MKHQANELYDSILHTCTQRMLHSRGCTYICILMHYLNRNIRCTQLRLMLENKAEEVHEYCIAALADMDCIQFINGKPELPIEMTDRKTLYAISRRFVVLRNLESEYRQNCDLTCLQEVTDEIDFLNSYLEETTGPGGIKNFCHQLDVKDYHAVEADIRRFLLKVKKRNETLYWQLKAHLHIGMKCAWLDD